ncbi:Protein CSN12 [Spathaspora sp. JA1]|nr:Protein CSN12 [Spathaspora sp. JA1]
MSEKLLNYLKHVQVYIETRNCHKLLGCLTINPGKAEGELRASFPEPNDFDLYSIPEKFQPVVINHLKVIKAIHRDNSLAAAFEYSNEMVLSLTRASESSEFLWIQPVLLDCFRELVLVYTVKEKQDPDDLENFSEMEGMDDGGGEFGSGKSISCLEKLAITFNKGFKLSLNDKNPDLAKSRRNDIYFYLANLIKIYFKLKKYELAKSVQKAVTGTRNPLPKMKDCKNHKKYCVVYLYYSAFMALDDGDYRSSEADLDLALSLIQDYQDYAKSKQFQQIMMLLLPLKLYNQGKLPSKRFWLQNPSLRVMYRDNIFRAVLQGDISKFDHAIKNFRIVLLKNRLYVLIESLRQYCQLSLVRKTVGMIKEIKNDHIISLSAFQLAFEYSQYHEQDFSINFDFAKDHSYNTTIAEVECILANLIASGKVKGYISHAQRCIVLSKSNPFPKISN